MNKQTYLAKLAQLLAPLPEQERQDALNYYEEYFDAAGPEAEDATAAELGDPADAARKILEGEGLMLDSAQAAAGESSANEPAATIVPRSRLVLAALLGGCLLAAAVLLVLARRHAMGYGRGSCNARVLAVFGSIYRLLVRRGLPPDTPSDAPEFAAFLQSCVPALEPQDAEALLALAQAAQFGAGTMTEQDTDKMRKLYQIIKHTGKRKQSQKSVEKQSQE